jgi:broad specificity phosphatase PhoE
MTGPVLLVRHTAVAVRWAGRCYGRTDVGLSRAGAGQARALASTLADWRPERVVHSGLTRTRRLAEALAHVANVPCEAREAWRERDFGTWEGRRWTSIYRESGDAMDGMIDDPGRFRPGDAETTTELAERALAALHQLPAGRIAVITHGGPIAAIVGTTFGLETPEWPSQVPALGGYVPINRLATGRCVVRGGDFQCQAPVDPARRIPAARGGRPRWPR